MYNLTEKEGFRMDFLSLQFGSNGPEAITWEEYKRVIDSNFPLFDIPEGKERKFFAIVSGPGQLKADSKGFVIAGPPNVSGNMDVFLVSWLVNGPGSGGGGRQKTKRDVV